MLTATFTAKRLVAVAVITGWALAASSCGAGTVGVVGSLSDDGPNNSLVVGSDLRVTSMDDPGFPALTSPAAIRFRLSDQENDAGTVEITYRVLTDALVPGAVDPLITVNPGSGPLTNLMPGEHVVLWDFEHDLGGGFIADPVTVDLEVVGGLSPPPLSVALGSDLLFDSDELLESTADLRIFSQTMPGFFEPSLDRPLLIADLDADGDQDLVFVDADGAGFTVYDRLDRAQYQSRISQPLTTLVQGIRDIVGADLNGTGILELVTANELSNNIAIFFRQGIPAPPLSEPLILQDPLLTAPFDVMVADMDADGFQDIAAVGASGVVVFFGEGGAFFPSFGTPLTVVDSIDGPRSTRAADLDGNGLLDLIVVNGGSEDVTLFMQDQMRVFFAGPVLALPGSGTSTVAVTVGDCDRDGRLDVITTR